MVAGRQAGVWTSLAGPPGRRVRLDDWKYSKPQIRQHTSWTTTRVWDFWEEDTNTTIDTPSRKPRQEILRGGGPPLGQTQRQWRGLMSNTVESICGNVRIFMALVSTATRWGAERAFRTSSVGVKPRILAGNRLTRSRTSVPSAPQRHSDYRQGHCYTPAAHHDLHHQYWSWEVDKKVSDRDFIPQMPARQT